MSFGKRLRYVTLEVALNTHKLEFRFVLLPFYWTLKLDRYLDLKFFAADLQIGPFFVGVSKTKR